MSKLTKQDFDDYLGKDAYYNEDDKERFYRTINSSKGWKKHWIPQALTVALVLGLFIVGIQIYQRDMPFTSTDDNEIIDSNPKEKTDWSDWIKAESIEDVDAFYESTIPGYRIAKELNQLVEINQKYALTDIVNLYIDKAWYYEDKIHLFYSMDLSDDELVTKNWDTGVLFDFLLHEDDNATVNLETDFPIKRSGVVFDDAFNNKLYRVVTITLEDESQLSGMDQLTASFSIDAHNEEVMLPEVELPVSYGSEVITSNALNESHQSSNSYINLKRFDQGADKGYLFGSIESDLGQELEILSGMIIMNNDDRVSVSERTINLYESEFIIEIPELATENISIQFDYLSMIENEDSIDISVDVSEYVGNSDEPVEKTMKQPIYAVGNNNIFLRSLHFDNQGIIVGISTEKIGTGNTAQIQFHSMLFPEVSDWGFSNVLAAVDNNGEEAKEHDFLTIENEFGSETQKFGLTRNYIEDKLQIDIKIKRLSISEEFFWNVDIPKQDYEEDLG